MAECQLSNIAATKIYQAAHGHEALKILKDAGNAIDISFIDLNPPGMDGMELIRHMPKQEHPPSIVLASALVPSLIFSAQTVSKAYGVNLLGSIEKPAAPDTVLNTINLHQSVPKIGSERDTPCITLKEMRRGILKKEFEPFFQPQVELASEKAKGLEAFARWRHPNHGILSPASFPGPLHDTNEVNQLDLLIFKKVLHIYPDLKKHDPEIRISVNMAAISCADLKFVKGI